MTTPGHVKKALRLWVRRHRAGAADLEQMRDTVRTLSLAAIRDSESPPNVRARYRATLNMWDTLIGESRAIADQADKLLRHKEVPPAEFASLHHRVRLLAAQVLAVTTEVRGAAEDQAIRIAETMRKPD
jgi:hypothetical protein